MGDTGVEVWDRRGEAECEHRYVVVGEVWLAERDGLFVRCRCGEQRRMWDDGELLPMAEGASGP